MCIERKPLNLCHTIKLFAVQPNDWPFPVLVGSQQVTINVSLNRFNDLYTYLKWTEA